MEGIKMNKITCICLGVRDMEKAVQFYRDHRRLLNGGNKNE